MTTDDMLDMEMFHQSSKLFSRRHTIDVETFREEVSDSELMTASSTRQTSDVNYGSLLRRLHSQVKSDTRTTSTNKSTTKPTELPRSSEIFSNITTSTEDGDTILASFRRRMTRRDRLLRSGVLCKVDISQPIIYPTTPETILEYHKAMPFLDENEEWLMVELNEYECLVDGIEIIRIIAKHSKFFEVEPDDLWEEFFQFVDDVPAYDEVINFDIWQEFRDKKYTC